MRQLTIVLVMSLAVPMAAGAQKPRAAKAAAPAAGPALSEIQGPFIAAHLEFLSHDLLEGRAPSTRGGSLAVQYLAAQLATMGIAPGGDDGTYVQDVKIVEATVDPGFTLTSSGGATFKYLADIIANSGVQTAQVAVRGDVVFVGHGIVAPEYRWNDYADADVTGKIVLVMVNDPPAPASEPELFGGRALTYYGRWTYKYEEAARQGAAGAILIHTTESATYPWQVVQSSWSGTQYSLPPVEGEAVLGLKAWVTEEAARTLATQGGRDLDALRQAAARRGFTAVPLGVSVSGTIRQDVRQKISPNVIGVIRGTNDTQAVVYTSHYDHFGIRAPKPDDPPAADRIYNGAQDNAAGVAGTLAVAQAFARAKTKPGRSIYFVFTTGEESGLLGSEFFATHPPIPIGQIAANVNIDGLNLFGRTRDMVLLGSERSSLGAMAETLLGPHDRRLGPDPEPGRGYFFRSDHFPLAKAGVPAVSLSDATEFIGKDPGFAKKMRDEYNDKDYHQPSDEFRTTWDYSGAVEDLRVLADLGWQAAASPTTPAYNSNDPFARPRARGRQ